MGAFQEHLEHETITSGTLWGSDVRNSWPTTSRLNEISVPFVVDWGCGLHVAGVAPCFDVWDIKSRQIAPRG